MRLLITVGALVLTLAAGQRPAAAYGTGPWCALFPGSRGESQNCGLYSFEQCLYEIRGTGGTSFCSPNPRYRPITLDPGVPRKLVRRHHLG
jgi:hypothetical protein